MSGDAPVRLEKGAKVDPGVVLDAEAGGIWIEANARVRPGAVLVGPVHVGPGSIIREQAVVRGSDIGPTCRVAGETNNSILQGWCNRAHEGHVGDSVLGAWSNLGAGTTISNLLNSYEEISVRLTPEGLAAARTECSLGHLLAILSALRLAPKFQPER